MAQFILRGATQADLPAIRALVRDGRINPTGLRWERFVVIALPDGYVVGCGQVKPHFDGSLELASIVVEEAYRNQGAARMIIEHLLNEYPGILYLMCREKLGPLYEKFGFREIKHSEMPVYFQRISGLASIVGALAAQGERLLVMRRN